MEEKLLQGQYFPCYHHHHRYKFYFSMHCPVHPVMLSPISGPIALKEDANLFTELGVVANSGHSVIILLLLLLL